MDIQLTIDQKIEAVRCAISDLTNMPLYRLGICSLVDRYTTHYWGYKTMDYSWLETGFPELKLGDDSKSFMGKHWFPCDEEGSLMRIEHLNKVLDVLYKQKGELGQTFEVTLSASWSPLLVGLESGKPFNENNDETTNL